jgi:hypothetical protein
VNAEDVKATSEVTIAAPNDKGELALKAMMNGQLTSRGATSQVWTLEKPDWMLRPPDEWTDQQEQLAVEFAAEQKRLDQELATRRAALEGEVCPFLLLFLLWPGKYLWYLRENGPRFSGV